MLAVAQDHRLVLARPVACRREHDPAGGLRRRARRAFAETIRDPAILRYTGTPVPTPDGWIAAWRRRFLDEDRASFAIVDNAGGFVGYAVTGPIDREGASAELGYAISPWARGRGHATEALRLLTDWAFADGIIRATLLIAVSSTASSRVAAKCGYTLEGVLRSVHQKNGRREDMQSGRGCRRTDPTDVRPGARPPSEPQPPTLRLSSSVVTPGFLPLQVLAISNSSRVRRAPRRAKPSSSHGWYMPADAGE